MPDQQVINRRERTAPIQSCYLTKEDLVKLYARLLEKVHEAADLQVQNWVKTEGNSGEFDEQIQQEKATFSLSITIEGENGETQFGNDESMFLSAHLPERILSVFFDSALTFRLSHSNYNPQNRFTVLFDFSKPSLIDIKNPVSSPTPNNSKVFVSGNNAGWVHSVFQTVMEFVEERECGWIRKRLHGSLTYDLTLWFLVFPFIFLVIFKIYPFVIKMEMPEVLDAAFYIYIFFFGLIIYRFGYSYTKWVWSKIHLQHFRDATLLHRVIWSGMMIGVISTFLYSIIVNFTQFLSLGTS